ncbi:hypothetical protein [Krasilnikovia cinnamomea]|nr:hypothetical protein [Krasilnikovia cinnamomea]
MVGWKRTQSGLYLPVAEPGAPGAPATSSKPSDRVQAAGTAIAALVAAAALAVSLMALRGQQEAQDRADQRFQQRYAERVAWWTRRNPDVLVVQNRSPVPVVGNSVVAGSPERGGFRPRLLPTSDVPPCTELTVELRVVSRYPSAPVATTGRPDLPGLSVWEVRAVRFHDRVGFWERGPERLVPLDRDAGERDIRGGYLTGTTLSPLGDCGTDT